jgi:lambda repressor-like predicted transcriptional regulator
VLQKIWGLIVLIHGQQSSCPRGLTKMNATLRKNGKKMATLTVTHHMTLEDLAFTFMAEYRYEEDQVIDQARELSKAKIVEKVKDYLYFQGKENAHYQVSDNLSKNTINQVLEVFKERFKEFN